MPSAMSSFNVDERCLCCQHANNPRFPLSAEDRKPIFPADCEYLFPFWVDTRTISPFWFDFVFHKPLSFPQLLGFSEQSIFTKSRYGHCCPYRLLLLLVQTVNAYSASSPSASSSSRARMEMLIRLLSMSMSIIFTFTTSPIATISFTFSTRLSAS